jgi:hypothetical protein
MTAVRVVTKAAIYATKMFAEGEEDMAMEYAQAEQLRKDNRCVQMFGSEDDGESWEELMTWIHK